MEPLVSDSAPDAVHLADLRAFLRVVDLGSMTAAAKSLGETKGSVSRRIARLEKVVGLPLVRRSGRKAAPTEEGILYRQKAGQALDQLEDALAVVRQGRGRPTGHLRVTAPVGIGTLVLGPMVGPFTEAYPEITMEILMTDVVLSFGQDRIDVALRLSMGLPDSSLVAHKLFDVWMRMVASPAYVARHGAPSHPGEMEAHRYLFPPSRGSTLVLSLAPVDGSRAPTEHTVRGHVVSHDLLVLREAALGGAGITFLPPELARPDLDAGRLVEVMSEWRIVRPGAMDLVTGGGQLPPKTRAFRDFVRDYRRDRSRCDEPPTLPAASS